jgi:hypothetical protein
MNENPETAPQQVEMVEPGAIASIQVSAGFYSRLQGVSQLLLDGKSYEQIESAHRLIEADKAPDGEPWVLGYETLLILYTELENNFRASKQTRMVPLDELSESESESDTDQGQGKG